MSTLFALWAVHASVPHQQIEQNVKEGYKRAQEKAVMALQSYANSRYSADARQATLEKNIVKLEGLLKVEKQNAQQQIQHYQATAEKEKANFAEALNDIKTHVQTDKMARVRKNEENAASWLGWGRSTLAVIPGVSAPSERTLNRKAAYKHFLAQIWDIYKTLNQKRRLRGLAGNGKGTPTPAQSRALAERESAMDKELLALVGRTADEVFSDVTVVSPAKPAPRRSLLRPELRDQHAPPKGVAEAEESLNKLRQLRASLQPLRAQS